MYLNIKIDLKWDKIEKDKLFINPYKLKLSRLYDIEIAVINICNRLILVLF